MANDDVISLDDEGEIIEEDESLEEDKDAPIKFDEEDPNIAITFAGDERGKEENKKVANYVIECFDSDWDSTREYRERVASNSKIFSGDLPKKDFPFENSANGHVPIMLENISRLVFRAYGELFGRDQFFSVLALSPADRDRAKLLTKHGNWQFRSQITDFRRQMHRGVLAFFSVGDVTSHSYRDVARNRNKHEILTPDEFVIPYVMVTTEPDYSDVPRKTKIIYRYRHELEAMVGIWNDVETLLDKEKPSWEDEPEALLRDAAYEVHGIIKPDDDKNAPHKLLHYEGWYTFSGHDRQRYIKAIVDYRTRALMELVIYETDDWEDKIRFDRETAEKTYFMQAFETYQTAFAQSQQLENQLRQNMAHPSVPDDERQIMEQGLAAQPVPEPPPAPEWMELDEMGMPLIDSEPAPVRRVPIQMFAHGVCIEPMMGSLGLSYGRIQADLNRAANTMLSQFTDSATLGNISTYVGPDTLQFEDGGMDLIPGRFNRVTGVSPREIKDAIIEFRPSPANPQLMQGVEFMSSTAQASIQSPNVMSGEPGKSGETYRGLQTRIEQANMQISVSTGKYADFFKQIVLNNAELNRRFMRPQELVYLADPMSQQVELVEVARELYERDYRVEITSDTRFTTQSQRVAEADEIVQMCNFPALQTDAAFQWAALKGALEARARLDLVPLLGPMPDPPQVPFGQFPPGTVIGPGGQPMPPGTMVGPGGQIIPPQPQGAAPGGPPQPSARPGQPPQRPAPAGPPKPPQGAPQPPPGQ